MAHRLCAGTCLFFFNEPIGETTNLLDTETILRAARRLPASRGWKDIPSTRTSLADLQAHLPGRAQRHTASCDAGTRGGRLPVRQFLPLPLAFAPERAILEPQRRAASRARRRCSQWDAGVNPARVGLLTEVGSSP